MEDLPPALVATAATQYIAHHHTVGVNVQSTRKSEMLKNTPNSQERYVYNKEKMLPPCHAVSCARVLKKWRERRRQTIPKEKITSSLQDQTNTFGYIARTWTHYNTTIEGPQLSTLLCRVGKMFINQSQPNSPTPQTLP